jgi:hypothetical protein
MRPHLTRPAHSFTLVLALAAFASCKDDDPRSRTGTGGGDHSNGNGSSNEGDPESSGPKTGPGNGNDPETPAVPYVDFSVNHVLVTGQSNSVSNSGVPVLSTTQPYANLMFDTGVMPMNQCDGNGCGAFEPPTSFVPLVEGDRFFDYPVETASAGIANEITFLAKERYQGVVAALPKDHSVLVSLHGRSGNTYWCLRKGGCNYKGGYLAPYEQAMMEVAAAKRIAEGMNRSYVVRAVATIHGESDHYSYTEGSQEFPLAGSDGTPGKIQTYADALLEWQADYETGIKAITGQTQTVPLFVSQISGWNDAQYSKVAEFQLDAHVRSQGKVVLIGPAYHLALDQNDCRHFTSDGQRRLGEYFAKVYARVIFEGRPWEPVRPKNVTRDGAVLDVQFHVPSPPLVIDTERVAEAASYGFDYTDASGAAAPKIASVAVTGPDTVRIRLASAPTASGGHLTYAQNQAPLSCIGTPRGARGNLHDSDTTPSKDGYDLHNWAVTFDVAVP